MIYDLSVGTPFDNHPVFVSLDKNSILELAFRSEQNWEKFDKRDFFPQHFLNFSMQMKTQEVMKKKEKPDSSEE